MRRAPAIITGASRKCHQRARQSRFPPVLARAQIGREELDKTNVTALDEQ
jgi:hypothetical protein